MDATDRMPGDAEAAGAAAAMAETYGERVAHAVGDTVTFQLEGWTSPRQGQVDAVEDATGNLLVQSGGRSYVVFPSELRRV